VNRAALGYLRDLGEICGRPMGDHGICCLAPGHPGRCDRWFPKEKLTREQRLARELAKLKAQRDTRTRHRAALKRRIADLERRRAWVERYIGFRIEYRLRGYWRGTRRRARVAWRRLR
jgi:hypothetical protein